MISHRSFPCLEQHPARNCASRYFVMIPCCFELARAHFYSLHVENASGVSSSCQFCDANGGGYGDACCPVRYWSPSRTSLAPLLTCDLCFVYGGHTIRTDRIFWVMNIFEAARLTPRLASIPGDCVAETDINGCVIDSVVLL